MPRTQLTRHFNAAEFDCNDGTRVPERYEGQMRFLCHTFLEDMRERFGRCTILSGFRTPSWNTHVGGASQSFHVYIRRDPGEGVAADCRFERGTPEDWARYANRLRSEKRGGKGGIGVYPTKGFVHLDTRDVKADWAG